MPTTIEQREKSLHQPAFCELLPVRVFVTLLALLRGSFEIHMEESRFKIRRFVAVDTASRTMRTEQRKCGLRMIEFRQFLPCLA